MPTSLRWDITWVETALVSRVTSMCSLFRRSFVLLIPTTEWKYETWCESPANVTVLPNKRLYSLKRYFPILLFEREGGFGSSKVFAKY